MLCCLWRRLSLLFCETFAMIILKLYEYVRNRGARSMRTCAYDGEGGQIFVILVRTY